MEARNEQTQLQSEWRSQSEAGYTSNGYVAPKMSRRAYPFLVDVIMYECLYHERLHWARREIWQTEAGIPRTASIDAYKRWTRKTERRRGSSTEAFKWNNLILGMLREDPSHRLTIHQVLQHEAWAESDD
ncbi:hypothetical protein MBLNU457_5165t1 [Dothideomycetes sp. NU457]